MKVHEANGYPLLVNGGQPSLLHPATHAVIHRADDASELISVAHVLTAVRSLLNASADPVAVANLIADQVDNVMDECQRSEVNGTSEAAEQAAI